MRFCNESANIGTFWELTISGFKIIGDFLALSERDNACNRFRSNIPFSDGIFL
jgi:hypothetical protein